VISSRQNPRIQQVRALLSSRKERTSAGLFIAEGVRLVEEAYAAGWLPREVFFSAAVSSRGRALLDGFAAAGVPVEEVEQALLDYLSATQTSQGILAVLPFRQLPLPPALNFVLIADALHDPGNLGAVLRSAAAAGVQAVFLAPETTDPFAPKVLRAAMGAHFRLPLRAFSWPEIETACRSAAPPLTIFITDVGAGRPYFQADLTQPLALIVGSEAEGVSKEARRLAGQVLTIPMTSDSESLNAAVAAGILLFEIVRQRSQ